MKAKEILRKENQKVKEQRAAKKEALKAKRMLGEDEEDEDPKKNSGLRPTTADSDSENEGFSSEDESFRTVSELVVDKKVNNSEIATFVTTTTEMQEKKGDEKGNPYELPTEKE